MDEGEKETYAKIVPDLVGEVRSKTDNFKDTLEKCQQWLANGVKEVWGIDPGQKIVLLRPDEEMHYQTDDLAISTLLSGFNMRAADF